MFTTSRRYLYVTVFTLVSSADENAECTQVSGRRRFNIISEEYEQSSGAELYSQIMQQYGNQILSSIHPQHRMVQRVLDRLVPHSGLSDEKNKWEVHVIKDEQKNAFVIPGGKVFVFSGILDVCQGDDGLAAVLGHEIAHNVAHHAAERMSSSVTILPFAILAGLFLGVGDVLPRMAVDFAFMRPGSRSQEVSMINPDCPLSVNRQSRQQADHS